MKKIELCVFDLAGTTIKDDGGVVNDCLHRALIDNHVLEMVDSKIVSPIINQYMGLPKPVAIEEICKVYYSNKPGPLFMKVQKVHYDFVSMMVDHYKKAKDLAIPGTVKTFIQLIRSDVKIALDTGFSKDITDTIMNRLGWLNDGLVDAVVSSNEVAQGRPHPFMIQKIMQQLGIKDASAIAKIGDTPADLQEGQNAGCGLVIGVTEGTHTEEQLKKYYHTHLIPNVTHLIPLLD